MSIVLDEVALGRMLLAPDGLVGKHVLDVATIFQDAARLQAGKSTHTLERSIVKRPFVRGADVACRVGSDQLHALIHHEGRGPVHAAPGKALRFKVGGQVLFRKSVGPAKPNRYLTDNLHLVLR